MIRKCLLLSAAKRQFKSLLQPQPARPVLIALVSSLVISLGASATAISATERLTIGYLELAGDSRYSERSAYARIQLRSNTRPLAAAEVALEEARMTGRIVGTEFALERYRGDNLQALLSKVEQWVSEDAIHFILLDLPADVLARLAAKTRGQDLLLFNVSAAQGELRRSECQAQLMHTLPSQAMHTDALLQYLVSKGWRKLLVLEGPLATDAELVKAFQHSAKRFGAELVAIKPFELGNDPRRREGNNIALLTAGESYDAVVVADSEGEFGRYVPYQTKSARPVVGTTGLVPSAWSWVWERHGAPQVNQRFNEHAGRNMAATDWAAWVAVKAIVQSALRSRSTGFLEVAQFLKSDELRLDGAKGPALSFRRWNNQLRQPILLATHDAVIARAPLEGFLHPRDTLDSLGDDEAESLCRFAPESLAKMEIIRADNSQE